MPDDPGIELRSAPSDPRNYLAAGVAIVVLGSFITFSQPLNDLAILGIVVQAIGGVVLLIGIIARGVFLGMRRAQYHEYLDRIIEEGNEA